MGSRLLEKSVPSLNVSDPGLIPYTEATFRGCSANWSIRVPPRDAGSWSTGFSTWPVGTLAPSLPWAVLCGVWINGVTATVRDPCPVVPWR